MEESVCIVEIPTQPEAVRVLRGVANAAAAAHLMSFDAIEDMDLALDEAGSALLEWGARGSLRCAVSTDAAGLRVAMSGQSGAGTAWPPAGWNESLSGIVLQSVAEDVRLEADGELALITFRVG